MVLFDHQYVLLLRYVYLHVNNLLPASACLNAFQQLCIYLLKGVLQSCGLSLFWTWSDLGCVM